MKHFCRILFLGISIPCFFFSSISAQDKFAPGLYVTNNQDTVRGYIQYKANYVSGFKFRPKIKSRSERMSVTDIKSFAFLSGDTYSRIQYASQANLPSKPIFVRMMVDGDLQLFRMHGQYYLGSEPRGRFRLAGGKTSNQGQALKNYQTNTGIFNILFQDCPAVKEEAQKTSLREEALISLLQSYDQCKGVPHREYRSKTIGRNNHFSFFVGESFSSLSFSENATFTANSSYLYLADFGQSAQPTFGIMGLLGGRHPSPILSMQAELLYTKADFSTENTYIGSLKNYDIKQTSVANIDYSRLSIRAGLRLTGRSNVLNPYVNFGLASNVFLSFHSDVKQVTEINEAVEEKSFELPMQKISFGVWGGVGVKKKLSGNRAVFIDANYENSFISNSGTITVLSFRGGFMF